MTSGKRIALESYERQVEVTVRLIMPKKMLLDTVQEYVREAVESWCGQFDPDADPEKGEIGPAWFMEETSPRLVSVKATLVGDPK